MQTKTVQSGYSRDNRTFEVRTMTFEEVKNASGHIHVLDKNGKVRQVKVNGSVKTWKTRPNNCKMPYKYGMYEYGYIEFVDGTLTSASPEPVVILERIGQKFRLLETENLPEKELDSIGIHVGTILECVGTEVFCDDPSEVTIHLRTKIGTYSVPLRKLEEVE